MASNVVVILAGTGLLCVAPRPLRGMPVVVLSGIFHPAKQIDYEEAIVALVVAMWLTTAHGTLPWSPSRSTAIWAEMLGLRGAVPVPGVATFLALPGDRLGPPCRTPKDRAMSATRRGGTLDGFALRGHEEWFFSGHSMATRTVRNSVVWFSPDPAGSTRISGPSS